MRGFISAVILVASAGVSLAADVGKPYRLESVDLKQRNLWSAECREPAGSGLAFGGQDQQADPLTPRHRPTPDPFPARRGEKQIPSRQTDRQTDRQKRLSA